MPLTTIWYLTMQEDRRSGEERIIGHIDKYILSEGAADWEVSGFIIKSLNL